MSKAYTTDDKGFSPLAAVAMSTEKIESLTIPASEFKVDAVFVMSPKAALEIQRLTTKRAGEWIEVRELHMPYDSLIVEMPITPEIAAMRVAVEGTGKLSIRRIAARIRRTTVAGHPAFEFWPFWEFENGNLGGGAVMVNVFTDTPPGEQTTASQATFSPSPMVAAIANKVQLRQNISVHQAAQFAQNMLAAAPKLRQEVMEEVSPLMFTWESIINCKSGISRTHVGPRKGVGSMLGRRKKIMANTEYTVVSLSAVETVSQGVTSQRADVEAHLVRGHFKRRNSGVYWWNPFIRGTGEVKQRKAYIMEGVPA
jgi:hypothetical protein